MYAKVCIGIGQSVMKTIFSLLICILQLNPGQLNWKKSYLCSLIKWEHIFVSQFMDGLT